MPCADFIVERGEPAFREQETAALADISKCSGLVLSTGGGVVTRDENYPLLHQNSQIVMLNRKLDELAHKGRPITARDGIDKLAEQRMPHYRAWADYIIDSRDCAANTAQAPTKTYRDRFILAGFYLGKRRTPRPAAHSPNRKGSNYESTRHQRSQPQHARHSRAGHLRQRQLRPFGQICKKQAPRRAFDEVEVFQSTTRAASSTRSRRLTERSTASSSTRPPTRIRAWRSSTPSRPLPSLPSRCTSAP